VVGRLISFLCKFSGLNIAEAAVGNSETSISEIEVLRRRDDAIRRALSTPRTPAKELVGKTERAQEMRESRVRKSRRSSEGTGEPS